MLIRLLDPVLLRELSFPCLELSLPLSALGQLAARNIQVIIVENKANLLTLPNLPRTIALDGMGRSVTCLRDVGWLSSTPIIHWGDLDVDGLDILSALRGCFRQVRRSEQSFERKQPELKRQLGLFSK